MKKFLAILLVVAMLATLAACGSEKKGSIFDNNSGANQDSRIKIARGTNVGDTYSNSTMGITFTKSEDWEFYTNEELAQMFGTTGEYDHEELLRTTGSFYDMMATDLVTGTNVIVMVEDLALNNAADMSESEYLSNLKILLNQTGVDYSFGSEYTTTLGGYTYHCMSATSTQYETDMEQIYYIRIVDGYVFGIISTLVNTPASTVEAMFS